jgi:hypothetical protein
MICFLVGQVGNLQRVDNPLTPSKTGQMRRLPTGAQDAILPHICKLIARSQH